MGSVSVVSWRLHGCSLCVVCCWLRVDCCVLIVSCCLLCLDCCFGVCLFVI